jgi:dTDP-4-amino-4,6-dideoxygalactose transaminase
VVTSAHRDRAQSVLAAHDIATLVHYPVPPHRQAAYIDTYGTVKLGMADAQAASCLSLPICPTLSESAVAGVCAALLQHQVDD